jgi:hypothetical protein
VLVLQAIIIDSELVYTVNRTYDDNNNNEHEKTMRMMHQIKEKKSPGVLSVFTLSYDPYVKGKAAQQLSKKRQRAQDIVMHNCLLTKHHDPSSQDFQFIIITDDLSMNVCQHCECRLFVRECDPSPFYAYNIYIYRPLPTAPGVGPLYPLRTDRRTR